MFDKVALATTEGLEALVAALSWVGGAASEASAQVPQVIDADRVDQLSALERLKGAVAAAQARLTAAFVDSQEQVAQAWVARAQECSDAGDFEGWRVAREQARAASFAE